MKVEAVVNNREEKSGRYLTVDNQRSANQPIAVAASLSRDPAGPQNGFTLLEVLLTLTLIGYVVACIYPCLIFTIEAKDKVESMSAVNKVGQAILRQMTHDLEGLYTLNIPNPFEGIETDKADSINFVTTVESAPNEKGIRSNITEVGYRVKPNEQEPDYYVLLRRESFFVKGDPLKGGTLSELFDRVKSFNLKYHNGKDWVDGWSYKDHGGLPLAVKIEFVIKVEKEHAGEEKDEPSEPEQQEGYFSAVVTFPAQFGSKPVTP